MADIVVFLIGVDETPEVIQLKLRWGINLLEELEINLKKVLLVFNKQDCLTENEERELLEYLNPLLIDFHWVFVSAKRNELNGFLTVLQKKIKSSDQEGLERAKD